MFAANSKRLYARSLGCLLLELRLRLPRMRLSGNRKRLSRLPLGLPQLSAAKMAASLNDQKPPISPQAEQRNHGALFGPSISSGSSCSKEGTRSKIVPIAYCMGLATSLESGLPESGV